MRVWFAFALALGCAPDDAARGASSLSDFVDDSVALAALDCRCTGVDGECWYVESEQRRLRCLHDTLLPFAQDEPRLFACWARAAEGLRRCTEETDCDSDRDGCYADWNHLHCGRPCSTIEDDTERFDCLNRLELAEQDYWTCQYER